MSIMITEHLFHLVAINEKHGWKEYLTSYPMTHAECVTMKGKFSPHPARRVQLEAVLTGNSVEFPSFCEDVMNNTR